MNSSSFIISLYRKLLGPIGWVLFFVLSFRVLTKLPIGIVEDIIALLFLLIIIGISFYDMGSRLLKGRVNLLLVYLLPLLILPFINAFQAAKVFDQPVLYGIGAQRQNYLILCGYAITVALNRNWITLEILDKNFLRSMYVILGIMFFFYIFIDPSRFTGTEFVKLSATKGWRYEFPNGVVVGLILYSIFKVWIENKNKFYIPFILSIIFFIAFAQDRTQLLFIFITICLFYLRNLNYKQKIVYGIYAVFALIIIFAVLPLLNPVVFERYITLYGSASSIFTGSRSSDSSTNIRFIEAAIAYKGILLHPWLGNGFLSSQWKDGYLGIFKYFYPSDIGIIGNLYVFGIIGTFFNYIPFIITLAWTNKLRKQKSILLMTCQYGMLFLFLDMLTAASNIKYIGLPGFFFGVIYYYRFYVNSDSTENISQEVEIETQTLLQNNS
jgi:hypothetical protein